MSGDREAVARIIDPVAFVGQQTKGLHPMRQGPINVALAKADQILAALRVDGGGETVTDTARLDWLERHVVNVRDPLPHGSHDLFWASPDASFEGEEGPSDIRAKIDRALAPSVSSPSKGGA